MTPAAITATTGWLQRCNFAGERIHSVEELPREVVIYLYVTWAVHPERLPSYVCEYLAVRMNPQPGSTQEH